MTGGEPSRLIALRAREGRAREGPFGPVRGGCRLLKHVCVGKIAPVVGAMDRRQCLQLLAQGGYGRVVFTERALPAIVPVNYLLDDGVVIGGGADARLTDKLDGAVVAFEASGTDVTAGVAWSVTVIGYACTVSDTGQRERLARPAPDTVWVPTARQALVHITPNEVTGRAFPLTDEQPGRGRLPWPSAGRP